MVIANFFYKKKPFLIVTFLKRFLQFFFIQEMLKNRAGLPIASLRGDILRLLKENNVLVVCGDTGSGKTTQVHYCFNYNYSYIIAFSLKKKKN